MFQCFWLPCRWLFKNEAVEVALRFQCCWSRCPRSIQFRLQAMARDTRFWTWDWSLAAHEIFEILEILEFLVDLVVSRHDQNSPGTTRKLLRFLVESRESPRWSSSSPSSLSSFTPVRIVGFSHHFNRVPPVSPKLCWGLPMTVAVLAQAGTHDSWSPIGDMRIYAVHIHTYTIFIPSYTNILCIHIDICAYICHMSVYIIRVYIYIYTYPWILLYWIAFMQQCSEADADLLRGIAFEYIEAVCIGFFTVEYVSWMHIRYSETMKWHNLEHQSSWIMRFCESCWHGVLDVKFRAVF